MSNVTYIELTDDVRDLVIRHTEFEAEDVIVKEDDNGMVVCGSYVIPIYALDASYNSLEDIEVIDEAQSELGVLCPIEGVIDDVAGMTESRILSWIYERLKFNVETSEKYRFSNSYLLLKESFGDLYFSSYYSSAPIWGGFSHRKNLAPFKKKGIVNIKAVSGIKIPKERSLNHLNMALLSSNSFDRFLKYYHQIEMIFDFVFVRKIKGLDDATLYGYREIIKSLSKKELDILFQIMNDYVEEIGGLIRILNGLDVNAHRDLIFQVFQNNDKEGNPLSAKSDMTAWTKVIESIELGVFSEQKVKDIFSNKVDARERIIKMIAYWIYRTRCSIAHNKISEFAFSMEDEKFVCEFAEPLIKEVILQIFSGKKFKLILDN